MRLAVIGAGWAGLAAAVCATEAGHAVSVFEASRQLGGRARSLPVTLPDGTAATLDNGQHILIGAYTETLSLMATVGVDLQAALLALPLRLQFPDGSGMALPALRPPLDALVGIVRASGWSWGDKLSLLRAATGWQLAGFVCPPQTSVLQLCRQVSPRVRAELIEPLCVSALNTPAGQASGQVFLRVLRDSLFGAGHGGMNGSILMLPRTDLGALFPQAAATWLQRRDATLALGQRILAIERQATGWRVNSDAADLAPFDKVILACPAPEAARLAAPHAPAWAQQALALRHEAITTVYAQGPVRLPQPMLALRATADAPAQFVFDRGQLGGPHGLLAFVVSASQGERQLVEQQVLAQAAALGWLGLTLVQTVVEKRATFACTPGLQRPAMQITDGLLACGDFVQGPYPATLEGAVRSAQAAVAGLKPD